MLPTTNRPENIMPQIGAKELMDQLLNGKQINAITQPQAQPDAAMEYLKQIPGISREAYDPYIGQGKDAYGQLNPIYQQMTTNPAEYLENLMKNYSPSKGYNLEKEELMRQRNEMMQAAANTAAAGGMRGTMSDIESQSGIGRQAMSLTDRLLQGDMQQWLQNTMGINQAGMQGMQDFYHTGYDASRGLSGDLSNVLGSQAKLGFQRERDQMQREMQREAMRAAQSQADDARRRAGMGGIASGIGAIGGGIIGSMLAPVGGGALGAMAGSSIGSGLGNIVSGFGNAFDW